MTIEEKIFKRAKIDFKKLSAFGFKKTDRKWIYCKSFMNGDFRAVVEIEANGNILGNVYETDSNDIYFPLRVESMEAGFAGLVRTEYQKILEEIKESCCQKDYFVLPQANRLAQIIYEKYGDNPVFPWEKFNHHGVFKNSNNGKWYAIVMNIDFSKLDRNLIGEIDVVNFKLREEKISELIKQKCFYPAYHMNKKSWISVVLNDTVSDEVLTILLDESHAFTLGKFRKRSVSL